VPDHNRYDNPQDLVDFQPGFGSLPNHHCLLASLDQRPSADHPPYSDGVLYLPTKESNTSTVRRHGESPGTGAFSYSLGRDFFATRDLKAGEEIVSCDHEVEDVIISLLSVARSPLLNYVSSKNISSSIMGIAGAALRLKLGVTIRGWIK
jgi:hypothetical protein